jgi:hypothetical protein
VDYDNFCKEYAIGSELLMCFKSNGPKPSKACVDALIAVVHLARIWISRRNCWAAKISVAARTPG